MEHSNDKFSKALLYMPNRLVLITAATKVFNIPEVQDMAAICEESKADLLPLAEKTIWFVQSRWKIYFKTNALEDVSKKINLDFYYVEKENREPLVLDYDALLQYLFNERNVEVKKNLDFPEFTTCNEFTPNGFASQSRDLLTSSFREFETYIGDGYFRTELYELYTIAANNVAVLKSNLERSKQELTLIENNHFNPQYVIYPRIVNLIVETSIITLTLWERIAFTVNGFFPICRSNDNQALHGSKNRITRLLSYREYFTKLKKKNYDLPHCKYYTDRLDNQHSLLNELLHPLIYCCNGTPNLQFICDEMETNIDFLFNELIEMNNGVSKLPHLLHELLRASTEAV